VDELLRRSETAAATRRTRARDALLRLQDRLNAFRLDRQLENRRARLDAARQRLLASGARRVEARRASLTHLLGKLDSLSPLGVLSRGYALVWDGRKERLLRRAADAEVGEEVLIRLHEGALRAAIRSKETP
jgi:exodeoxyribonuclease VII large subunit